MSTDPCFGIIPSKQVRLNTHSHTHTDDGYQQFSFQLIKAKMHEAHHTHTHSAQSFNNTKVQRFACAVADRALQLWRLQTQLF